MSYSKPFEEFTEAELIQGMIQQNKREFILNEARLRCAKRLKPSKIHPKTEINKSIKTIEHNIFQLAEIIQELETIKEEYEKQ